VLNSCIEVSNYYEPYSLCQPPSSLPDNPWFNDDKPRGIHNPLHFKHHSWLDQEELRTPDIRVYLRKKTPL
jgi:hypothetical protein